MNLLICIVKPETFTVNLSELVPMSQILDALMLPHSQVRIVLELALHLTSLQLTIHRLIPKENVDIFVIPRQLSLILILSRALINIIIFLRRQWFILTLAFSDRRLPRIPSGTPQLIRV